MHCPLGSAYSFNATTNNVTFACVACPVGFSSNRNYACQPCSPGTFAATVGSIVCTPCPVGTYSTGSTGNSHNGIVGDKYYLFITKPVLVADKCRACDWPKAISRQGSPTCDNFSLDMRGDHSAIFVVVFVVVYAICIWRSGVPIPAMLAFSFFPLLDLLSDILYVALTTFYHPALFAFCVIFLASPHLGLLYRMYKIGALLPGMWFLPIDVFFWLGCENGLPTSCGTLIP